MKPFILGINGSPRNSGHVSRMLNVVLNEAKRKGARIKQVNLSQYKILPHSGKLDDKIYLEQTKDDIIKLQRLVLAADGIVFATPTHWFNVSSLMKLFLDRLTSLEHFGFLLEGKVAGFITYGPQGGALNSLMNLMIFAHQNGMVIPPYVGVFDEGRKDSWSKDRELKLVAKNMMLQIAASKTLELNWGYPGEKYKVSPTELL